MKCKMLLALVFVAVFTVSLRAAEPQPRDPIEEQIFPPELIMMHRVKLDLGEQQQSLLKAELQSAQATFFDLQWQLNDESEKLVEMLKTRPIDEAAMLVQSDTVMELERRMKRTHLTLLARLKNMLSREQIELLHGLRAQEQRK